MYVQGIFLNETATQAQLAVRYEIEKHNNVSSHSSFKLDKFEKFLDITNNALVVTLGIKENNFLQLIS